MRPSHSDIAEFIQGFFAEMRTWQVAVKKRWDEAKKGTISHEEFVRESLECLKRIFDKWCIYKEMPENITFAFSPSYDPEKEKIVEIEEKADKFLVYTDRQTIIPHQRLKYTLVQTPDGLRIKDNRKRLDQRGKYVDWDLLL